MSFKYTVFFKILLPPPKKIKNVKNPSLMYIILYHKIFYYKILKQNVRIPGCLIYL